MRIINPKSAIQNALRCTKLTPDEFRPCGAADIAIEFFGLHFLKMCRLGEEKQFVDRLNINPLKPLEVQSHTNMAEEKQHFLAAQQPGRAERAEGAIDLVVQRHRSISQQCLPCVVFVVDDLG